MSRNRFRAVWDKAEEDIAFVFAPDGPVAHLLDDAYRPRRGQALMARLVKRGITLVRIERRELTPLFDE